MLANRVMYMGGGGGANGVAEGVGHVQPLGYGSYGKHSCGKRGRGGERQREREREIDREERCE